MDAVDTTRFACSNLADKQNTGLVHQPVKWRVGYYLFPELLLQVAKQIM